MNKRKFVQTGFLFLALICAGVTAKAASSLQVMSVKTESDQIVVYTSGAGELTEAEAFVGQKKCEEVSLQTLQEAGTEVRTLLMVDNSLSIPADKRDTVKSLLKNVSSALAGDQIAIATISESVTLLCDWTQDQEILSQTIEDLEFLNQETYLTDALYDYLSARSYEGQENILDRILLISDGVDNKSLGYTAEELIDLLKENPIPIYTVGVSNDDKENEGNLERMFSISRTVAGNSCLLGESEEGQLIEELENVRSEKRILVRIPPTAMDGSRQTLTVTLKDGENIQNLSVDGIRMPVAIETETATETETVSTEQTETEKPAVPEITSESETESEIITTPEEADGSGGLDPITLLCVLAILVALGFLFLKNRKKKGQKTSVHPSIKGRRNGPESMANLLNDEEKTVFRQTEEDETVLIPQEEDTVLASEPVYYIRLTDTGHPERVFEKVILYSLTIGYSEEADLCINYDKSVSRKQCEIIREETSFYVMNHSHSNITVLDGVPVTGRVPLYSGSVLSLGAVNVKVEIFCDQ